MITGLLNLFGPRLPDSEVQQRFPPEAMQAVFSQHHGDTRHLRAALDAMTRAVDTSSSEAQRALLRELRMSGVVGFASTLLLVHGQREDTFAFCCEVLRLVHLIEEDEEDDAGAPGGDAAMTTSESDSSAAAFDRDGDSGDGATASNRGARRWDRGAFAGASNPQASSSLSCCVVPLLRAAASRGTDAAVMKKYAALIVSAALLGVLPDYSAGDEPFSSHATLALQTAQRLFAQHLTAEDCAQCAPVAAAFLLRSTRRQIERFFRERETVAGAVDRRNLWRETARLCLQIVHRASTYVRPRDILRITRALEHVLRHFYSGDGSDSIEQRLATAPSTATAAAAGSSDVVDGAPVGASAASVYSNDLRTSLGELVAHAARVVHCAANDGWLPITRRFFDRLVGAASAALQDPEVIATGAFAACFASLPRVASVALTGGALSVAKDIVPPIAALWDTVDRSVVPDGAATCNRDALASVAEGLLAWQAEFHAVEALPSWQAFVEGERSDGADAAAEGGSVRPSAAAAALLIQRDGNVTDALQAKVQQRRVVWGARRLAILQRVEATTIALLNESLSRKRGNNGDAVMSSWFRPLWHRGFFVALLAASSTAAAAAAAASNDSNATTTVPTAASPSAGGAGAPVALLDALRQRRLAVLRFAQGVASSSCPELLQLVHLIPVPADAPPSSSAAAAATAESDGAVRTAAPPPPDLLRRLLDRCRGTRRGAMPPPFISRTLALLNEQPCPVCALSSAAAEELPSNDASAAEYGSTSGACDAGFVDIEEEDDDGGSDGDGRNSDRNSASALRSMRLEQDIRRELTQFAAQFHVGNMAVQCEEAQNDNDIAARRSGAAAARHHRRRRHEQYALASTRTLHRLVQIMCEASSRMGEHVGWRAVAESALQLFTCSRLFLHGKRRLFEREVESPNARARSNAQRREAQSLLRVCPYMRMGAVDWRGLARIFARGRGWIWDDRAVQSLRDAFDEQLLRHLWSLRHDLVARCIVTQNLRYEVTVPLVAATAASAGAAESAARMHNVTSRISARFVRWIVLQIALLQNAKASTKSCAAVADLCCRFLFSLECPKTFDSFAGLLMKEEEV